jgi:hypothetical protein
MPTSRYLTIPARNLNPVREPICARSSVLSCTPPAPATNLCCAGRGGAHPPGICWCGRRWCRVPHASASDNNASSFSSHLTASASAGTADAHNTEATSRFPSRVTVRPVPSEEEKRRNPKGLEIFSCTDGTGIAERICKRKEKRWHMLGVPVFCPVAPAVLRLPLLSLPVLPRRTLRCIYARAESALPCRAAKARRGGLSRGGLCCATEPPKKGRSRQRKRAEGIADAELSSINLTQRRATC